MKLLEPGQIGSLKLKNRVFMAPMGTTSEQDGAFSDRSIRYLEERAKGGFGMIITGANQVTLDYEAKACNVLGSPRSFEQLNFLARRVHLNDSRLVVQLTPGLGRMQFTTGDITPHAASAVGSYWFPEITCKPYTVEQIRDLVVKLGQGAAMAKAAGADAVELHGYGGYLMDQFSSTLWNTRTDEYGGDLAGRLRFPIEAIAEVRRTCGPDFPILYKFTAEHGVPGGRDIAEGIEMAKMLEAAGVDALHVDVGCYEAWYKAINTVYEEAPTQIDVAAQIREHVSVPVLAQGKLGDPDVAERVLQEGKTDYVGLGHASLTDPHWVNKVVRRQSYDIIPCIGCNECLFAGFSGKHLHCAVNPQTFAEDYYPVTPALTPKRVLVIGGGAGGLQAAITAAERGLEVELWERASHLGGTLLPAGGPTFKRDVATYVQYLIGKVYRSDVTVRMNTEATAENVLAGGFDKVILSSGARHSTLPVPGVDGPNVVLANDVLVDKARTGRRVVVIGGGLVGCETAAHCAETADEVTIIETLDDVLRTVQHSRNNDQSLRQLLADRKVNVVANAKVTTIGETSVEYEQDGADHSVKADTCILAVGYTPNNELFDALNGNVDVSMIGDAVAPDSILTAVHQAFHIIRSL